MKPTVTFKDAMLSLTFLVLQVISVAWFIYDLSVESTGFLFAQIIFGPNTAPSDIAIYFDSVFTQSMAESRKIITDNIGNANAFVHKLLKSDMYESYEGGTMIMEPLMYALAPMESYSGYDELSTATTDGITDAIYESRQLATPCSYSMKEMIDNKHKITSLVKTKITQTNMGIQEGFATHLMQGAGSGSISTPKTNAVNGSLSVDPIAKMVAYDPTASASIGNINQSTSTWWRNRTKQSAATTYNALIQEFLNMYNTCSLGTGGAPDLVLVDQITYELMSFALSQSYRNTEGQNDFPFTNIRLPFGNKGTLMVLDEKTPNASAGTLDTSATGKGTAYFLNTKFLKLRYIPERDFEMLTDENGKVFVKPINQDSRIGHCAWMGQFTINQRRKQGVIGNIARTLTVA